MLDNDRGSELYNWLPFLRNSAEEFYNHVCSINEGYKEILAYNEASLDKFYTTYCTYRKKIHEIHDGTLIDRHKIIAACALSFTHKDNLPFSINKTALMKSSIKEFSSYLRFANEIYIYESLTAVLSEFVLATKKAMSLNLLNLIIIYASPIK